jgi:hypothetical protein
MAEIEAIKKPRFAPGLSYTDEVVRTPAGNVSFVADAQLRARSLTEFPSDSA